MRLSILIILLKLVAINLVAQVNHPHLLVKEGDKAGIRQKIDRQEWARKVYDKMYLEVTPFVERHKTDREWILSRYLMNRAEGRRYTHAYSDSGGTRMTGHSGDAPVPTVRVSTHKRPPITEKGSRYIKPRIEELAPNDTSSLMWLMNPETRQKDLVDPQSMISDINGDINDLALSAAIIYWLQGDESYARFAADILDQWARGAYYQEPIVGPCRTGFLDMQTLGDGTHRSLILAYDFLKPYMERNSYDLSFYQTVFEKFAHTMAFRGLWNNNWYAAESSMLVFAALSLEDPAKRNYYLQYFLERDTISGSCGQLGLPSTVENWLTPDGHWKEPGGYHNFPVSNLLIGALALDNNGYDVFRQFPALFQASYAMLKYSFPNLRVSAFGDTGRAFQSPQTLEIGLAIAVRDNLAIVPGMMAAMNQLTDGGIYKREDSGFLGLLCFLPELPKSLAEYEWPRGGELDFARFYLQRNGMDPRYGLMYGVQGASYNHNHCNGMAMELYGCGEIMAIDAGTGPTYEHPMHVNYFSQWAAHNTVVSAGASSAVPFSGGAGRKNIGQVELAAMEPLPGTEAVSANYSFTDTRYFDPSTETNQLRTMAIIRTSPTSGYYVDIYRSDNSISNDYVYHNIGDRLTFSNEKGTELVTQPAYYPLTGKDFPGFRFFSEVERLENHTASVTGLFSVRNGESGNIFMQVVMPGAENRTYFRAKSPAVKTAGRVYSDQLLPVLTVRTEKEAWSTPFMAVFEPFSGEGQNSVVSVERQAGLSDDRNTVLKVLHRDKSEQWIFQGNDLESRVQGKDLQFSGHFGVASIMNGKIQRLYLGEGSTISFRGIALSVAEGNSSAEVVVTGDNGYVVNGNRPLLLEISDTKARRAYVTGPAAQPQEVRRVNRKIALYLPAGKSVIVLE
jgi:hypothetical protein